MSDPFQDARLSVETRISRNLSESENMDRAGLDYYHPDGDGYMKGFNIERTVVSGVVTSIREVSDVPSNILDQAVEIFHETGIKEARKRKKKYIVFACIYNAALALGYPVFLTDLAEKCGMTKDEITPAMSIFGKCGDKKLIVSTHMEPSAFIFPLCQELNRESLTEDIQTVISDVLDRQPGLMDVQPMLVAAASIHYYATILGMSDVTVTKLAEVSGLTASSIEKMSKNVGFYHNDCDG